MRVAVAILLLAISAISALAIATGAEIEPPAGFARPPPTVVPTGPTDVRAFPRGQ
jgi:hypothetical protein